MLFVISSTARPLCFLLSSIVHLVIYEKRVCNFCVSGIAFLLLILFFLLFYGRFPCSVQELQGNCQGNVHLQISFNLIIHKKGATTISMIYRYILNVISLSSIAKALYLSILITKIVYAKAHNPPDIYI